MPTVRVRFATLSDTFILKPIADNHIRFVGETGGFALTKAGVRRLAQYGALVFEEGEPADLMSITTNDPS